MPPFTALPPKVFALVINNVDARSAQSFSETGDFLFGRPASVAVRVRTLKALSLVSEGTRKLSQPLLFSTSTLGWVPEMVLSRAQALLSLLGARPESATWLKTLNLSPQTQPPLDDAAFSVLSELLSKLKGLRFLALSKVHSIVADAPPQLFASLVTLHVTRVTTTDQSTLLLRMLSRCPKVVSLTCDFPNDDPDVEIAPQLLPRLKHFIGPMTLAKLIVPGRQVETLRICSTSATGLHPALDASQFAVLSSKSLRSLELARFSWGDGWLQQFATFFPLLESLVVRIDPSFEVSGSNLMADYFGWLLSRPPFIRRKRRT